MDCRAASTGVPTTGNPASHPKVLWTGKSQLFILFAGPHEVAVVLCAAVGQPVGAAAQPICACSLLFKEVVAVGRCGMGGLKLQLHSQVMSSGAVPCHTHRETVVAVDR